MIDIDWITNLIANIPEILSYIVCGYAFLSAYCWISFNKEKEYTNFVFKSVAISYILKSIYAFIGFTFTSPITETVVYVIVSASLGFVIGKIITHRWFNNILSFFHVGRTTNDNIWNDIIKPCTWVRVFMKDGKSYLGLCRKYEAFEREPIMVLQHWQLLNKHGNTKVDNHKKSNEVIVLNLKDFDRIELTYDEGKQKNK